MSKSDLVRLAREGDRDAFDLLMAAVVDHLYRIARLILRDFDSAEDAVQEALVRCWRDLPKLRDPDRFDAWLNRLLLHSITDEAGRSSLRDDLRVLVGDTFPRRPMIGFGIFMAVLLAGMWLPLIAQTYDATSVPQLNGGTTLVVQAFDLGLLVPLGLFTAMTVQRRMVAGSVLSAIVVVKGMTMGAAIASMLVVEWSVTGVSQLPPIVIFGGISVVSAILAWRVYGSIDSAPQVATATAAAPARSDGGDTARTWTTPRPSSR